ncbi:histidine phosphatase family protein [Candidatus Collierbacteria bacterium]|nr:histidine phosphatase family protein [Candidatus Collierbacteria bacterium]
MVKIYLIRHAESIANTQGIYQGQTYDLPLSELGQQQARALGAKLARIKLNAIFTSPLTRTKQTVEAITGYQEKLVITIFEDRLKETNHGAWEGKRKTEIAARWPEIFQLWQTLPGKVEFPGGEKFTDTANRAIEWFNNIFNKTGVFAVVTHSNIIQAILTHLHGLDLNNIWQFEIAPTGITVIEFYSPIKIVKINDISHLKNINSDLSKQAL